MDLSTISVSDFKDLFYRDFPYLNTYDETAVYYLGDKVYFPTSRRFYELTSVDSGNSDFSSDDFSSDFSIDVSAGSVTGVPPTNTQYWTQFADDIFNYVQDIDIDRAQSEAEINFSQAMFENDETITLAFHYLTAHYLVNDLKTAANGLNSSPNFVVSSKSVGSVSESYAIPDSYKNNPTFQFFAQTAYGNKYLAMLMPRMVGNVFSVGGATRA